MLEHAADLMEQAQQPNEGFCSCRNTSHRLTLLSCMTHVSMFFGHVSPPKGTNVSILGKPHAAGAYL